MKIENEDELDNYIICHKCFTLNREIPIKMGVKPTVLNAKIYSIVMTLNSLTMLWHGASQDSFFLYWPMPSLF